jgi:hypothetical protein
MRRIGRTKNREALVRLVDAVLLFDAHRGEKVVRIGIDERDVGADGDARGVVVIRR